MTVSPWCMGNFFFLTLFSRPKYLSGRVVPGFGPALADYYRFLPDYSDYSEAAELQQFSTDSAGFVCVTTLNNTTNYIL